MTHPGRDLSHKQVSCVCKPDHTPFFLHKEDLLHKFLCCNKSPHLLTAGRRSLRSIPTMTHHFALQTVPLLATMEKGKTPSIKQFLPLAPKEHHTRDTGEKNSAKQHILAKTHQEFPIKVPFYLPLKRFNTFFRTLIPQNKTHHHIHTKQ